MLTLMLTRRPVPGLKPWVMIGRKWSALCAVLVSGLKSAASKKERFMTRCIEAPPRGGTSVPFFVRAPMGALRCFPIMAQDFSPGRLVCRLRKKDVVFIFLLFFIFGIL